VPDVSPPGLAIRPVWGAAVVLALLGVIAVWPAGLDRWALPKVLLLGIAALVAVVASPRGRLPLRMLWLAAAATLILAVAAFASSNPAASLFGVWPRYEGLVSGVGYALAIWVGARLLGPDSAPSERRFVILGTVGVAVVLAVVTSLEAAGLRPLASDLSRPGALLGNATDQGAVAAAFAVILASNAMTTRPMSTRIPLIVCFALASSTVILSGSRAALLALAIGFVAAAVLAPLPARRRVVGAVTGIILLVAASLLTPISAARLTGTSPLAADTIADRLLIWREALEVVARHPVLGVGPSGFADAVAGAHRVDWFSTVGQTTVLDSPHDVILQALVVGGPVLCLALLVAMALVVAAIVRRVRGEADSGRRGFVVATALGAGAITIVELTTVTSPGPVMLAGLLVGAAVAVPATVSTGRRSLALRVVGAVVVTGWITLVTTTLVGETALGAAVADEKMGEVSSAESAFATAHSLRPWDPQTVVIAAEAFTERLVGGDHAAADPAVRWSRAALRAAPGSRAAGQSAITVDLAVGDLIAAETAVTHFRALLPYDPWFAHRAGAIALLRGDDVDAEKLLRLSIRLDPTSPDPWLTLAYLYQQRGDTAAAADATAHAQALQK
jgi:O-antigen ligase